MPAPTATTSTIADDDLPKLAAPLPPSPPAPTLPEADADGAAVAAVPVCAGADSACVADGRERVSRSFVIEGMDEPESLFLRWREGERVSHLHEEVEEEVQTAEEDAPDRRDHARRLSLDRRERRTRHGRRRRPEVVGLGERAELVGCERAMRERASQLGAGETALGGRTRRTGRADGEPLGAVSPSGPAVGHLRAAPTH